MNPDVLLYRLNQAEKKIKSLENEITLLRIKMGKVEVKSSNELRFDSIEKVNRFQDRQIGELTAYIQSLRLVVQQIIPDDPQVINEVAKINLNFGTNLDTNGGDMSGDIVGNNQHNKE